MMRWIISWLLAKYVPQPQTKYEIMWQPRPDDRQMAVVLRSLEIRQFFEHCQKIILADIVQANDEKVRNEYFCELRGLYRVENAAKEIAEGWHSRKAPETEESEDVSMFDLSDAGLIKDHKRMVENGAT